MKKHFLTCFQSLEIDIVSTPPIFSGCESNASLYRRERYNIHERDVKKETMSQSVFKAELSTMMSDWNENTFIRLVSLFHLRISLVLIFNSFLLRRKVHLCVFGDANGNSRTETKIPWVPNSHHQNKETKQPTDPKKECYQCHENDAIGTIKAVN